MSTRPNPCSTSSIWWTTLPWVRKTPGLHLPAPLSPHRAGPREPRWKTTRHPMLTSAAHWALTTMAGSSNAIRPNAPENNATSMRRPMPAGPWATAPRPSVSHPAAPQTRRCAPARLIVHVDYETLFGKLLASGRTAHGARISGRPIRTLACMADIVPVAMGGAGEVLDYGRSRRLFSGPQLQAMATRDRGCLWPGCPPPTARTAGPPPGPVIRKRGDEHRHGSAALPPPPTDSCRRGPADQSPRDPLLHSDTGRGSGAASDAHLVLAPRTP